MTEGPGVHFPEDFGEHEIWKESRFLTSLVKELENGKNVRRIAVLLKGLFPRLVSKEEHPFHMAGIVYNYLLYNYTEPMNEALSVILKELEPELNYLNELGRLEED